MNGNGWKPRKTESFTTMSGQVVQIKRPGPEFMLRAARVARTFTRAVTQKPDEENQSPQEYGLSVLAKMGDEELAAVMIFARELICAMIVSPKLVLNPRPGFNEIGPDDVPDSDFWELFNRAMTDFFGFKIPVGNEEVEVSDLETFRAESGVSGNSVDGPEVRPNAEQPIGDQRLVSSP